MNITLDNYEAFFLDYIEGRLNSEELSELSLFLALHPGLKSDLEISENTILLPNKHIYLNKNYIKKLEFKDNQINKANFEDFCIAYYENMLSVEKSKELMNFYETDPSYQQIFSNYKKVFLTPSKSLIYPYKKKLYKSTHNPRVTRVLILRSLSVAATFALFFGSYTFLKSFNKKVSMKNIASSNTISYRNKHEVVNEASNINELVNNKLISKSITKPTYIKLSRNSSVDSSVTITIVQKLDPGIKLLIPTISNTLKEVKFENENMSFVEEENRNLASLNSAKEVHDKPANKKKKLSLLTIAKAGIFGFNKLTNSNLSLTEKTDSLGNITALSFQSDLVEYHRSKSN